MTTAKAGPKKKPGPKTRRYVDQTPEERKAYNREAAQRRRDKTANHYARAYRRASQDAIQWVKDNHPEVWELLLAEQLAQPQGDFCSHDKMHIAGKAMRCDDCGQMCGTKPLD